MTQPGPWTANLYGLDDKHVRDRRGSVIFPITYNSDERMANAAFIASAPADMAALIGEVERLRRVITDWQRSQSLAAQFPEERCANCGLPVEECAADKERLLALEATPIRALEPSDARD